MVEVSAKPQNREDVLQQVVATASPENSPIRDVHCSSEYRMSIVGMTANRTIQKALKRVYVF